MPPNHTILCCPLLLLPSFFPSIRIFSNESTLCIRWPWSFIFSISPSNEYSGLISFTIDWFDLLAVQRTLRSFLLHHNSKASILWCSAFFMVQFSHLWASLVAQLVKNHLQCGTPGFDPRVEKIPSRRERLPTPIFWRSREFHRLYRPRGCKESDATNGFNFQVC